jgi:hypothetical protein
VLSVREERNNWSTAGIRESEVHCLIDSKEDMNEWAVSKGPKGIGVSGSSKRLNKAELSGNGTTRISEVISQSRRPSDQTRVGHPTRILFFA